MKVVVVVVEVVVKVVVVLVSVVVIVVAVASVMCGQLPRLKFVRFGQLPDARAAAVASVSLLQP